jgi:hypothetical protein
VWFRVASGHLVSRCLISDNGLRHTEHYIIRLDLITKERAASLTYHDGIETGNITEHESLLQEQGRIFLNSKIRDGAARKEAGLYCCLEV